MENDPRGRRGARRRRTRGAKDPSDERGMVRFLVSIYYFYFLAWSFLILFTCFYFPHRFSDTFDFLMHSPKGTHLWCGFWDLMGPLLETFHGYFDDNKNDSPLKLIWKRISYELNHCTQCVCQHYQAQDSYNDEYESQTVGPLLKLLRILDEERVTQHLKHINAAITKGIYNAETHAAQVVSVMFEVSPVTLYYQQKKITFCLLKIKMQSDTMMLVHSHQMQKHTKSTKLKTNVVLILYTLPCSLSYIQLCAGFNIPHFIR